MKAFSYSRYSSDAQRKGTSIDRQQTLARKWCIDNGVELSERVFADEAVSGFDGSNLKSGALGEFIADVESDVIEAGSILILENLDRLTRMDPWDAVALLQKLLGLSITVVTLRPEVRFDPAKRDSLQLLQAVLSLDNAHRESARKSDLGKIEWAKRFARARESDHHIGKRVSNWLTLGEDGNYHLNNRAATVKRIFELCLQGLGSTTISQTLNAEGHATFNKGELSAAEGRLLLEKEKLAILAGKVAQHPESETFTNLMLQAENKALATRGEVERLKAELTGSGDKLSLEEVRAKVDMKDKDMRRRANAFLHRLGVRVHIADGYLVLQGDEARAMFAVSKNRIGCSELEGDPGDIPDLTASNAIAATVKTLLAKPSGGFVYRGDVTTPNGRGTRRVRTADLES